MQAGHPVVQRIAGRQQEYGKSGLVLPQLLKNRQAIAHGHANVQHRNVEMLFLQQILGHRTVGRVFHLESGAAQLVLQGVGQHGIVFGKQQFHARSLMDC